MTRIVLLSALGALAALSIGAASAQAQSASDGRVSTTVRTDDLDLGKAAGAKAMLGRIEGAAERVCGPAPSIFDLDEQQAFVSCVKETTAIAVQSLDSPMVTATHGGARPIEQASAK